MTKVKVIATGAAQEKVSFQTYYITVYSIREHISLSLWNNLSLVIHSAVIQPLHKKHKENDLDDKMSTKAKPIDEHNSSCSYLDKS